MRRWMAALLVFAAAVGLTGISSRAAAQDKAEAPVEETFLTADGVQLRGLFHKSAINPGTAPVVILLYPPGKENNMTKGDWGGLANTLATKGYHVFRFDWRGHGKSTDIKDPQKFWGNGITGLTNQRYILGANKKPLKNDLFYKDYRDATKYLPVLLNDLAAVRAHLDQKNDNGELNTSSVYLIGAESAATLGLAWLTTEWTRPAVHPQLLAGQTYEIVPQRGIVVQTEAGETIAGAVWLSAARTPSIAESTMKGWVAKFAPKLRENNPMLFLYGDKDNKGKGQADFFFNEVLVANPRNGSGLNKLEQTFAKEVTKGGNLTGAALLGNNKEIQTEDTIIKFLAAIQKERAKITRKQRNYASPYFIDLRYFGVAP